MECTVFRLFKAKMNKKKNWSLAHEREKVCCIFSIFFLNFTRGKLSLASDFRNLQAPTFSLKPTPPEDSYGL